MTSSISTYLGRWYHIVLIAMAIIFVAGTALFVFTNKFAFLLIPFAALITLLVIADLKLFYRLFIISIPLSVTIFLADNTLSTVLPIEPLMIMGLGFVIIFILYRPELFPKWFLRHKITFIVVLQLFWLIISVINAQDFLLAFKFLSAKIWFLASCFIFPIFIFKEKKDFRVAFRLLVIPTLLHACVVFVMHGYYNFGYFESNQVVLPFYKNHVDYGSMLSMILPLIGCAYYEQKKDKKHKKIRRILYLSFFFLLIAVYFSYSRGAILAVIFSGVIFVAIRMRAVNLVMPTFYIMMLGLIFYMAKDNRYLDYSPDKAQNASQDTFFDTVMGAFTGKDMSSMERFYRWIATLRMSSERPILGVGPNNWYYHYKPHTVSQFETWVSRNPEKSTTHNYFLLLLSEQGYPSMILYGFLIIVIFAEAQKTYHRFNDKTYKRYTMALTMLIAAAFINNFFSEFLETHKVGATFYIALAILIILDRKSRTQKQITE